VVVIEESYDLQLFCYTLAASRVLSEPISSAAVVFTADPDSPLFHVEPDPETITPVVREVLAEVSLAAGARIFRGSVRPGARVLPANIGNTDCADKRKDEKREGVCPKACE